MGSFSDWSDTTPGETIAVNARITVSVRAVPFMSPSVDDVTAAFNSSPYFVAWDSAERVFSDLVNGVSLRETYEIAVGLIQPMTTDQIKVEALNCLGRLTGSIAVGGAAVEQVETFDPSNNLFTKAGEVLDDFGRSLNSGLGIGTTLSLASLAVLALVGVGVFFYFKPRA